MQMLSLIHISLYAGNDIKNYAGQVIVTKGTALETVTTGEDGKASYSVDLPISNGYYVSETQAPYAYIRNSKDCLLYTSTQFVSLGIT